MYTTLRDDPAARARAPKTPNEIAPSPRGSRLVGAGITPSSDVHGFASRYRESGAQLIVDLTGRILWNSPAAAGIARESTSIAIDHGRLVGATRHSARLLASLIADSCESSQPVDQLLAPAANELPELFIRATSCSGRSDGALSLTIRELRREVDQIPDLARLYGLTPTEQQITKMMLQGRSVTEIAQELGKSVLTVRTHIKRTYVKFNVGTKEQLFSTLVRMMVD